MTEYEWMTSVDPKALLNASTCLSSRKLRLWVEACRKKYPQWKGNGDLSNFSILATAVDYWSRGWSDTEEATYVTAFLRDIIGNPFHKLVLPRLEPCFHSRLACGMYAQGICPWLTPTVRSIINGENTPDPVRLAVLADALIDAGCDDEYILMHLRGKTKCPNTLQGNNPVGKIICWASCACCGTGWVDNQYPHVQGCHVIDFLLEKE